MVLFHSRRCMMLFLYKQLIKFQENEEESIFELCADGYFQLKDGIEFHLFITTSPCGDARIFSLHESSSNHLVKSKSAIGLSSGDVIELKFGGDLIEFKSEPDLVGSFSPPSDESGIETDPSMASPEKVDDDKNVDESSTNDGGAIDDLKKDEPSKDSASVADQKDRRQADSSKGMLRSKIECGMGTVPINPKLTIQTWDGVLSGDRLLTMACSDKIMRWNIIGMQGALLSLLVRPIYWKSITVGSKFHPGHMKRALYERIADHVSDLPDHFRLNIPQLFATTSPETRQATKAHDYSVNWILDEGQPEIVNGSTGKTINDTTSRLSKRLLFEEYLSVSKLLKKMPALTMPARYSEVKQMATDYQSAKIQVSGALVTSGCGHWVEKPVEQDQFSIHYKD